MEENLANNVILRELFRMHRQFADLFGRLQSGPRKVRAAQARMDELENLSTVAIRRVLDLRVATDEKQANLDNCERNLERRRGQLMEAKNNTEYQNLKDQIAADEASCSVQADEILEALERLEVISGLAKQAKADWENGKSQWEKITASTAAEKEVCEAEIRRLLAIFQPLEKKLNGDFLGHYRRIFSSKRFDSLAPLDGATCEGCHTVIPLELIVRMAQDIPAVCTVCGRLLFLPENFHV